MDKELDDEVVEVLDEEQLDRGDFLEDEEDEDTLEDESKEEEEVEDQDEDESSDDEEVDEDEDEDEEYEPRIPKSRVDEIIAQREEGKRREAWLEEQLAKLVGSKEASQHKEDAFNFEEAEEKYTSLILEGEVKEASRLRTKIDSERRKEILALVEQTALKTTKTVNEESAKASEEILFKATIDRFEKQYSFLNANKKAYNEDAVDTINTLMKGYVAKGLNKSEALEKAVAKIVPMYEQEPKEKTAKPKGLGDTRKVEATKKAAKASNSQPQKVPVKSAEKVDPDAVDISRLSEKDFRKLTAAEKKILRGD